MTANLTMALKKKYLSLDLDQKRILQVMSIVYRDQSFTELRQLLTELNWTVSTGKGLLVELIDSTWKKRCESQGLIQLRQGRMRCDLSIIEFVTQDYVNSIKGNLETLKALVIQVLKFFPISTRSYNKQDIEAGRYREIRHAFYLEQYEHLLQLLEIDRPFSCLYLQQGQDLFELSVRHYQQAQFDRLPMSLQYQALMCCSYINPENFAGIPELTILLDKYFPLEKVRSEPWACLFLARLKLYNGQWSSAKELLDSDESEKSIQLTYYAHGKVLEGDYEQAILLFEAALVLQKKETRKRNVCISGLSGILFLLALLKSQLPQHKKLFQQQQKLMLKDERLYEVSEEVELLGEFESVLSSQLKISRAQKIFGLQRSYFLSEPYCILLISWFHQWMGEKPETDLIHQLKQFHQRAVDAELHWYAIESYLLLKAFGFKPPKMAGVVIDDSSESGVLMIEDKANGVAFQSMMTFIQPQPDWMRSLTALKKLTLLDQFDHNAPVAESRLIWSLVEVDDESDTIYSLQPKEQKTKKAGGWTKGRNVPLERLATETDNIEYLTQQDKLICKTIGAYKDHYSYYSKQQYRFDNKQALLAAVDHCNVYWDDKPGVNVKIIQKSPELIVTKTKAKINVSLRPFPSQLKVDSGYRESATFLEVIKEGPNQLSIVDYTDQHISVAEILGASGLKVPAEAKQDVLDSISAIAPLLTVHSDIGGGHKNACSIEADPRLHIHLQPVGVGLNIEWYVRPFSRFAHESQAMAQENKQEIGGAETAVAPPLDLDEGPLFRPGVGGQSVFTDIQGQSLSASRNLKQETRLLKKIMEACGFDDLTEDQQHFFCEDMESSFEVLLQLEKHQDDVVLFWPQGQAYKLKKEASSDDMQIRVNSGADWFSVEGELKLPSGEVIEMEKLLALLQESPGRFVALKENEFMTLTQDLRKRLDSIAKLSDSKGRMHHLAVPVMDEVVEGMQVKASKQWKKQLERFKGAQDQVAEVPSTLQAELRDYQLEGFRWLSRLAHWGAGACLADDMGLGKTLQTLAVLLTRASGGPALVLAPTSVCLNWVDEAKRFAPTLAIHRFGSDKRQELLDALKPFDVLICSYGLLQNEAESLSAIEWHTIVADEAQAIKNPLAKRSQAVMALKGDFKIVTTGTPIENHLGELWSLFRFINPGLLDTQDKFYKRFANAIETQGDDNAREQLKRLIQPFILRRLKSEVLTELPSRTEITLNVELSKEEKVFYEALRRQAVERIADTDGPAGQQRVKILAEITRLRRACCHPKLVVANSKISSSKLKIFGETVNELLENKHKVLVFSQFVTHLALIKAYLKTQKIHYQYLDGSTPVKKRKQAVDDFQSGKGDVFLISLKAGGSGLNLTAADYVIHMDPWWNPAAEDQASDRAHRMGQQKPVTIYRMVASGTIEDKIVDLHQKKRDLASSLLEGSEMTGKMGVDDMLNLLSGEI